MDNNKIFAAYALTLVGSLALVLTFAMTTGLAKAPPPLIFIEHLAMGLAMRAAYKSFGGFDWAEWSLMGRPSVADDAPVAHPADGIHASAH